MSKTFLDSMIGPLCCERGIGLITAIFVIVVVGMFGTLIARYAAVSAVSSAEDYHWAQALYSAHSAAQVRILYNDGGGAGTIGLTDVAGFSTTATTVPSGRVVQAAAQKNVSGAPIYRMIEVRTSL